MRTYKWRSPKNSEVKHGIDYVDNTGKRVRRIVASTRKGAEKILAKIRVELETGEYYDRKQKVDTTVGELIERYKVYFSGKDSYETECCHLAAIESHFKASTLISSISQEDVEVFQRIRENVPSRHGGKNNPEQKRTQSTVNRELECFRRLLNKAIDWRLLRDNPVDSKILFDEPKGKIFYLSVEEAGALLDAAEEEGRSRRRCKRNPHLYAIILTALETGARLSNILNLKWADIDFSKSNLYLPDTKPGTSLEVPMSSRLADAIKQIPQRLGSEFVFAKQDGAPYKRIDKSFHRAREKAGIPKEKTFHSLRHTFITHELDRGISIHIVAKICGQSTTYMTERYGHLIKGREHEAVDRLPEWRKEWRKESANVG